ncbi:hypothetical protein DWX89_02875 [Coprobacillus sp. AF21-8LB]|nr:hypothetical protein DWX89_02875 [Coprobacillus sp. AF21-8LB]
MIKFVPTKYECIGKNNRIYIGTIKNSMLNKTRVNNISNQQAIKESTKSSQQKQYHLLTGRVLIFL